MPAAVPAAEAGSQCPMLGASDPTMFSATKSHARVPTIAATWWRTTTPIERPSADHNTAIRIPLPNSPASVPIATDTPNP